MISVHVSYFEFTLPFTADFSLSTYGNTVAIVMIQWRIQDFPVGGGVDLVGGGRGLPRLLRFVKFVCQNERIGPLGGRAPGAPP